MTHNEANSRGLNDSTHSSSNPATPFDGSVHLTEDDPAYSPQGSLILGPMDPEDQSSMWIPLTPGIEGSNDPEQELRHHQQAQQADRSAGAQEVDEEGIDLEANASRRHEEVDQEGIDQETDGSLQREEGSEPQQFQGASCPLEAPEAGADIGSAQRLRGSRHMLNYRRGVNYRRGGKERRNVTKKVVRNMLKTAEKEKSQIRARWSKEERGEDITIQTAFRLLEQIRRSERERDPNERVKKDYAKLLGQIMSTEPLAWILKQCLDATLSKFHQQQYGSIKGNNQMVYQDTMEDLRDYLNDMLK